MGACGNVWDMAKTNAQTDLERRLGLSVEEYNALEKLAQQGDRSVAAEIRRAIRKHVLNPKEPVS